MCREMKQVGTRTLIVDLRRNEGGNSATAEILTYFLYGEERLLEIEADQIEILRCSPSYLERHPGVNLDNFQEQQCIHVCAGDYVFEPREYPGKPPDSQEVRIQFEKWAESMPTFNAEYLSGEHGGRYTPERVFMISSARTFSFGYTLMYYLWQAGAEVVGVPSAQAGNCFGDIMDFTLSNSELYFTVPCKYFVKFPGGPDKSKVLMPEFPLTYEILWSYNFDIHASILYAMDLARQPRPDGK